MNPKEKLLAAKLLEQASDKFSRRVCNDYPRPTDWSPEEWDSLIKSFHDWNGDPEEYRPGTNDIWFDFPLMSFLATKLAEEANGPTLMELVATATAAQCGCTSAGCIHDQIRIEIEKHYLPNAKADQLRDRIQGLELAEPELKEQLRVAAEAEAEALRKHIIRLEAEIDLLTKQRTDAEQCDALEKNRADEWEKGYHELEAQLKALKGSA